MADLYIGLKIPSSVSITKLDKLLVVILEVNIGPILSTLPPITQVTMGYCCVYLLIIVVSVIVFTTM